MAILEELKTRGILKDITNKNKFSKLKKGTGVYIGFDPTADSLHLGNYIQIALLLRFKRAGYNAIAVLGGATGMIGDPSGKSSERNLLDNKELISNKSKIKKQLASFGLKIVDNYDFYKNVNVLDFLKDTGKLININYMINKDIVSSRLETGISFTEFSYQMIQGNDFLQLYKKHDVKIQLGGSDQWGNITTGVELIRKVVGDKNEAVGITTNLLTTKEGKKFGKSEGNAIWLDKSLTSSFQIYQYLLNTSDDDLKTLLNWLTFLTPVKIGNILKKHKGQEYKREAQKILAYELIKDIHSEKDANQAIKISSVLFSGASVKELKTKDVLSLEGSIPTSSFKTGNVQELLVSSKIASSKREAREFIKSGSIEINGNKINDPELNFEPKEFSKKASIVKKGKKKFFLVKHI